MQRPMKAFIVTMVSTLVFVFGAAPANATPMPNPLEIIPLEQQAPAAAQQLNTSLSETDDLALETLRVMSDVAATPHNFDVDATIALALSEVGTSRATGWNQPGECLVAAQRWILAGGGNWTGSGDPVNNYQGATRLPVSAALPGDVIQYEHIASPTSWVSGVHTVLVTGVNADGTLSIVESNNPGGSGLVTKTDSWVATPPAGFQAVAWRF